LSNSESFNKQIERKMNEYPSKCHTFALVKRLQVRVKAAARQNSSKLDSALTLHFTCPRKQVATASETFNSSINN
jgi:hypothetical protein